MPRKRQENVKSSVKNRKCRRYKVSFKRQLHCLSRRVCRQWGQYPCTCCGCAANSPVVQLVVACGDPPERGHYLYSFRRQSEPEEEVHYLSLRMGLSTSRDNSI